MPKVLLCDDDFMNRKVASKILRKEGFVVIEATNGQEALELLSAHTVDLILMDLMMPLMNGYDAIRHIKANLRLAGIPLIIISALSDTDAVKEGMRLGADAYLSKPYNIDAFRLCIADTVHGGSSHA